MKGRYNEEGRVGVVVTLGRGARDDAAQVLRCEFSAPIDTADGAKSVPI